MAIVPLAALFGGSPDAQPGSGDGSAPPSGASPVATRGVAVGGIVSGQDTFDGFPMYSALGAPWAVSGDGAAQIVALPTSVDRSVRIASSGEGGAMVACRPTGVPAGARLRVAFDYRLGRSLSDQVTLMTLRAGDVPKITLVIDERGAPLEARGLDGTVVGPLTDPDATAPPADSDAVDWQRLEITVFPPSGAVTWRGHATSGAETGLGIGALPGLQAEPIDTICVHSPEGSPSGWVAVDDLVTEG